MQSAINPLLRPRSTPPGVRRLGWVALVLALLGLVLALPIPLTMPVYALMVLRIGAAELSLWLLGLNGGAALLAGMALRRAAGREAWVPRLALMAGLIGTGIAAIPGSQLPTAIESAEMAMRAG